MKKFLKILFCTSLLLIFFLLNSCATVETKVDQKAKEEGLLNQVTGLKTE